jgi:hypothetical protein
MHDVSKCQHFRTTDGRKLATRRTSRVIPFVGENLLQGVSALGPSSFFCAFVCFLPQKHTKAPTPHNTIFTARDPQ